MTKRKIQIYSRIDPDQLEQIEKLAKDRKCNSSEIIRKAIFFYLNANGFEKINQK